MKLNKKVKLIFPSLYLLLIACSSPTVQQEGTNVAVYSPCNQTIDGTDIEMTGKDPLAAYQWYLEEAGINTTNGAWAKIIADSRTPGQGVQIAIIDDALQLDHEDLDDNFIVNASINVHVNLGNEHRNNPYPENCVNDGNGVYHGHGTAVAGIIAAEADNGLGVKGISYGSKLWGANLLLQNTISDTYLTAIFSHRVSETTISSNSWGSAPTQLTSQTVNFANLINAGLTNGAGGRGITYLFSGGNDRVVRDMNNNLIAGANDMASYSALLNHRGIVPICSVGFNKQVSDYSEPGPNIWVCGYSNQGGIPTEVIPRPDAAVLPSNNFMKILGLPTTDLSGDRAGYNLGSVTMLTGSGRGCGSSNPIYNFGSPRVESTCNGITSGDIANWPSGNLTSYHRAFTGTSAAAPMVSGVVGLLRSYKSNLNWRDVKIILAESAQSVRPHDSQPSPNTRGTRYTYRVYQAANGNETPTHVNLSTSSLDLISVDLISANLGNTNLTGWDLAGANLAGANLSNADLSGANLSNADLSGADLSNADLSATNLTGATLTNANLIGAYVSDAILTNAVDVVSDNTRDNHFTHHPDYGFGIIDAAKVIDIAGNWISLPAEISWVNSRDFSAQSSQDIPYSSSSGMHTGGTEINFIEYVEVEIAAGQAAKVGNDFGELQIELTSPQGSKSVFAKPHTCTESSGDNIRNKVVTDNCPAFVGSFTFASAVHLGENPDGNWVLRVNRGGQAIDNLSYKLRIYGHL